MAGKDNVHKGHRARMRKRFIEQGNADGFEDHELIEMLLYYAVKRRDTNVLAHKMLNSFGSLRDLFDASVQEIMETCGVSENTAFLFSLIAQILRRYNLSAYEGKDKIISRNNVFELIRNMISDRTSEQFFLLCLDEGNHLIKLNMISNGNATSIEVKIENIIAFVIKNKAAFVIIGHNHPGHTYGPSSDDIAATERIKAALSIINVVLIDHIIICGNRCFSFAQNRICGLHY